MKVLITGLPLFSKQLAEHLSSVDSENSYKYYNTYYSRWGKIKFILALPFCSHVISMNGVTDNSGILNLVLKFKKKLILQWMGTDSLLAMERYKNGTINRKYIDYGINLIDSEWLEEEIKSIDVKPIWQEFKFLSIDIELVEKYESIHAISYVAESRQSFYGIHWIQKAALDFPDVQFHIYGTANPEIECPANVIFHGWLPASVFVEAMRNSPIFLRLTEHDGFSVSVIEALCSGAEVIATLPSKGLTLVKEQSDLKQAISAVIERIEAREMKPNHELSIASKRKWNRETQLKSYVKFLKTL